jgi:hypothetical protein
VRRRTYPGEDQGEDIREGYEPTDSPAAVAPKGSEEIPEFAIGDDEEDKENDNSSPYDSEESKQWREASQSEPLLKPKYGTSDEVENVWASAEPAEPARENP